MVSIKRIACSNCESLEEIEFEYVDDKQVYKKQPSFSEYQYEDKKSGQTKSFFICDRCKRIVMALINEFCLEEGLLKND